MSNIQGYGQPTGGYSTGPSNPVGSTNSSGASQNMRKLYIRNLHFKVVSDDLKAYFQSFGSIVKCDVPGDPANPGKCKGQYYSSVNVFISFAFVEFEKESSALEALEANNNKPFQGRPITISFADNKERSSSNYPPRQYDNNGGGRGGYQGGNNYNSRPPYQSGNDYQRRDYGQSGAGYGNRDNNGGGRDDSRQPYNSFQRQGSNSGYDNRDRRDGYKSASSGGYDRPRDDRRPMGLNDKAELIESLSTQRDTTKKDSTNFSQTPPAQTSQNLPPSTSAPTTEATTSAANLMQQAKDTYTSGFISKPLSGVNPVTQLTIDQIQATASAPTASNIDSTAKPTQQSNYGSASNSQLRDSSTSYRPRGDYQSNSYGGKPSYDNRRENGAERSRSRDRENGGGYQKRPYDGGFSNRGGYQDRPHYQRDGNNHRGFDNRGGRDFRRDDDRGNSYADRRGGSPGNRGGNDRPFFQRRDNHTDRRSGSRERPQFNRDNSRGSFGGRDFRGRDSGGFRGGYDGGNFRGGDRGGFMNRGGSRGGNRGGFGGGGFRGGRGGRGREDDDVPAHHTFDANRVAQASAQFAAANYGAAGYPPAGGYSSGGYQQTQSHGGYENQGSYPQGYGGSNYQSAQN